MTFVDEHDQWMDSFVTLPDMVPNVMSRLKSVKIPVTVSADMFQVPQKHRHDLSRFLQDLGDELSHWSMRRISTRSIVRHPLL